MYRDGENPAEGSDEEPELKVRVSNNKLEADLIVKNMPEGQTLSEKTVDGLLAGQGVVSGICKDNIHNYCTGKDYSQPLVCAKGTPPQDEGRAELKFMFSIEHKGLPSERADGTVDYHDLGIVQNVKKGDVLCRIIPPPPGKDGIDVFGNAVPFKKCRMPSFPTGLHTVISKDGLELSAAISGCIDCRKNILNVNETFVIKGDVDNSTGNIDFIGTVIVRGDVMEGFSVKAGGNIAVYGMVEGATLQAVGSITVNNGINGLSGGGISAGGDVESKYIQNAVVRAGGDVYADVIMNSNVKVRHCINMRGPKASIMGGSCCAGRQVYAKKIGTANNVRTNIVVDSKEFYDAIMGNSSSAAQTNSLKAAITKEYVRQKSLRKQMDALKQLIKQEGRSPKNVIRMKVLLQNSRESEKRVENFSSKISEIKDATAVSAADFNVIGLKVIYAGTKITIGTESMNLSSNYNNMKFYVEDGKITSGPPLPSDEKNF